VWKEGRKKGRRKGERRGLGMSWRLVWSLWAVEPGHHGEAQACCLPCPSLTLQVFRWITRLTFATTLLILGLDAQIITYVFVSLTYPLGPDEVF
jgi:hypothetical protein